MKDSVVIKSYQNGITLNLNHDVPFDVILSEVHRKFADAKAFFGKSKMALSIKGRFLSEEEENSLISAIEESGDVTIICIVGNDEDTNEMFFRALNEVEAGEEMSEDLGQFYRGNLKNNQVLETESSIIVLGNVLSGSTIISAKNIIVLGSLQGEAYAGVNGNQKHFIVALDLSPEVLKIGDYRFKQDKKHKWGMKNKTQPMMAYIENKAIVTKPLTNDFLGEYSQKEDEINS